MALILVYGFDIHNNKTKITVSTDVVPVAYFFNDMDQRELLETFVSLHIPPEQRVRVMYCIPGGKAQ